MPLPKLPFIINSTVNLTLGLAVHFTLSLPEKVLGMWNDRPNGIASINTAGLFSMVDTTSRGDRQANLRRKTIAI